MQLVRDSNRSNPINNQSNSQILASNPLTRVLQSNASNTVTINNVERPKAGITVGGNDGNRNRNKINDPLHTVFFYNIPFNLPKEEFISFASQYGEIYNQYLTIDKKGTAFITYFDIRNSERAVGDAQGKELGGRNIGTNFAFTPPKTSKRDPYSTCATVIVKGSPQVPIKENDISDALRVYGEIRSIEAYSFPYQWKVKFFDIRTAKLASENSGKIPINASRLIIESFEDGGGNQTPSMATPSMNFPPPPPPPSFNNYQPQQYQEKKPSTSNTAIDKLKSLLK